MIASHNHRPWRSLKRPAFFSIVSFVTVLFWTTSIYAAQGPDENAIKVAGARSTLDQWVETRRLIATTKTEWREGRSLLDGRIGMLEREIQSMQERIADTEAQIQETGGKMAEMSSQREALKTSASILDGLAQSFESRVLGLLSSLPIPLQEQVRPLSQSIPSDGKDQAIGLSRRFQNIIGILDAVDKFHREITASSEIRQLADGTPAEVTVIYLGISMAYYATANGLHGGVGFPSAKGWAWHADEAFSSNIAQAIAIFNNEQPASYVQLPLSVQ